MDAITLVVRLLEKASVLVAVVLVLVLVKPAHVWLHETGREASVRRRLFLALVMGAVAVWGVFLGMSVGGQRFNVRMLGIVVAGFLGGRKVGSFVGLLAGAVYAWHLDGPRFGYALAASVLVGALSGWWSRRFGTSLQSVAVGATAVQLIYHALIGGVMAFVDPQLAIEETSNLPLHIAKITANVVGVTVFMGLLQLMDELDRLREETQQSKQLARDAKLEALQYQVQPHFLFNILNTLSYLIRTDPNRARSLTLDLSDFLRYTLSNDRDTTTLRDELKQIERYVELERARFGDGLEFEARVPAEATALSVPPLLLQPLVENAIRHGARDGRVRVEVTATVADDGVLIEVVDDGPGPDPEKMAERQGIGLQNVRDRLERYYHVPVVLELRSGEGGGAVASFVIPVEDHRALDGLKKHARNQLRKVVAE
ncbi:MAG: histidine kinase [bacterium]